MSTREATPLGTQSLPLNAVRQVRSRLYSQIAPTEIINRLKINAEQARRELRRETWRLIDAEELILSQPQKETLVKRVLNDVLGFGPIEPLLNDASISEIMINGPYIVFIERAGKVERTDITFEDAEHLLNIIDKIVSPIGRRVDESSPMVDARLPDGSRVNVIIPPVSLGGPVVTIRRFRAKIYSLAELVENSTVPARMHDYLTAAIDDHLNIVVTGGTGSGKTTFLNALSGLIAPSERIVTIEDAAELKFNQPHVITLESRPANIEGRGRITIRDLVVNALRMRPDRIVVGEVRGGETLDMLQAMNTGHNGSLTTAHANSPSEAISRLETMALMAGMELPIAAIRRQIAGAFDLIIHMERRPDGGRAVTDVVEVAGLVDGDVVLTPALRE